ncbi:hypothetical protein K504DRAFT_506142 [Pleomassaria siparia CBS 279.74]|uniref:Uncharacterized protein n=1 Tax=Pleomassaria siparia CBS 279.74 TaxID=1314801 RepID=A0A6G1JYE3_9PLEO|nr:hypothetical protein K504DRAFT_506142 [Pleomassaria siparia CBS 279.74]
MASQTSLLLYRTTNSSDPARLLNQNIETWHDVEDQEYAVMEMDSEAAMLPALFALRLFIKYIPLYLRWRVYCYAKKGKREYMDELPSRYRCPKPWVHLIMFPGVSIQHSVELRWSVLAIPTNLYTSLHGHLRAREPLKLAGWMSTTTPRPNPTSAANALATRIAMFPWTGIMSNKKAIRTSGPT